MERNIARFVTAIGACVAVAAAGCGGEDKAEQAAPKQSMSAGAKQSTSEAPSSKQKRAAGIPESDDDRKKYFMRIYCIGDSQTQCQCKFESMGGKDGDSFADVLYKLKRADQATVLRFGRASTGCT